MKTDITFVPSFDENFLFIKGELIPAVVQEESGEVLMLAYMNKESFLETITTGTTCFYSRSRQKLWRKGETSGHVQKVLSICTDCDNDTLLITVSQTGSACHTGNYSCFYTEIYRENEDNIDER